MPWPSARHDGLCSRRRGRGRGRDGGGGFGVFGRWRLTVGARRKCTLQGSVAADFEEKEPPHPWPGGRLRRGTGTLACVRLVLGSIPSPHGQRARPGSARRRRVRTVQCMRWRRRGQLGQRGSRRHASLRPCVAVEERGRWCAAGSVSVAPTGLARPGQKSEAKPAAATPAGIANVQVGAQSHAPSQACMDSLASRCRPTGASILTCRHPSWLGVSASFSCSGLLDVPLPIITPSLRRRLSARLHAVAEPQCVARRDSPSPFHLSPTCQSLPHVPGTLAHKPSQRHVDGLHNLSYTAPGALYRPRHAAPAPAAALPSLLRFPPPLHAFPPRDARFGRQRRR